MSPPSTVTAPTTPPHPNPPPPGGREQARLRVLTGVVVDHPGVLTRVAGMVRRRGFNIQGLSVGPTDEHGRSRMTLAVDAGHAEVDQVQKQLDRLIEVIEVEDLTEAPKLSRELALVKLAVTGPQRDRAVADVDRFGARLPGPGGRHAIAPGFGGDGRDARLPGLAPADPGRCVVR